MRWAQGAAVQRRRQTPRATTCSTQRRRCCCARLAQRRPPRLASSSGSAAITTEAALLCSPTLAATAPAGPASRDEMYTLGCCLQRCQHTHMQAGDGMPLIGRGKDQDTDQGQRHINASRSPWCAHTRCVLVAPTFWTAWRLRMMRSCMSLPHACMHLCMYVCLHACMHLCMYACLHACMHV